MWAVGAAVAVDERPRWITDGCILTINEIYDGTQTSLGSPCSSGDHILRSAQIASAPCSARRTCPGRNSYRETGISQSRHRRGGPEVSHRGASHPAGPATRPAGKTAGSHASHREAPRPGGDPGVQGCFGVGSLRTAQPRAATPGEPWRAGPFGRSAPTLSIPSAIRLSPGHPRRPTRVHRDDRARGRNPRRDDAGGHRHRPANGVYRKPISLFSGHRAEPVRFPQRR